MNKIDKIIKEAIKNGEYVPPEAFLVSATNDLTTKEIEYGKSLDKLAKKVLEENYNEEKEKRYI